MKYFGPNKILKEQQESLNLTNKLLEHVRKRHLVQKKLNDHRGDK